MRIGNSYMRRIDDRNELSEFRKRKHLRSAQAYLDSVHRFELEIGGWKSGQGQDMTGREAKVINMKLQQDFVEAVANGKPNGERLHRWVLIEKFPDAEGRKA